jgi:cellobiose phosphorylase
LSTIWEGRDFLPRVLLPGGEVWGGDDLFLEPQVFALLDAYMPLDAKKALWQRIRSSVLDGEPLGARQRESPPDFDHFKSGNRENGGIWYALNGPLIVALAGFAPEDARKLLQRNTLAHHAATFPDQWPGIWSSSDNLESGLRATAGMPDPESIWSDMPIYCAHPHAWPVYAWNRLNELKMSS